MDRFVHAVAPARIKRQLERALDTLTTKMFDAIDSDASMFTVNQMQALQSQVASAVHQMTRLFDRELGNLSADTVRVALDELGTITRTAYTVATGRVIRLPLREIAKVLGAADGLQDALLRVHRKSIGGWSVYAIDKGTEALALSMAAGDSGFQAIKRVQTAMQTTQSRAEVIVRTELAGAAGATTRAATEELSERVLPGLAMRWTERVTDGGSPMDKRVGVDSMAMHGQVARKGESFVMPPTAPNGKRVSSKLSGKRWKHPPNRPQDRAVLVPWHPGWGTPGWRWQGGQRVEVKAEPVPAAKGQPKRKQARRKNLLERKSKAPSAASNRRIEAAHDLARQARLAHTVSRIEDSIPALEERLRIRTATANRTDLPPEYADLAQEQLREVQDQLAAARALEGRPEELKAKAAEAIAKLKPHERADLVRRQVADTPDPQVGGQTVPEWEDVRRTLRAHFQADGYQRGDFGSDELSIETMRSGVAATHSWSGKVRLGPDTAERAQKFVRAYQADPAGATRALREIEPVYNKARKQNSKLQGLMDTQDALRDRLPDTPDFENMLARRRIYGESYQFRSNDPEMTAAQRRIYDRYGRISDQVKEVGAINTDLWNAYRSHPAYELRNSAHGLSTVIHEEVHDFGPLLSTAYRGPGLVIEETATELMARAAMQADWGVQLRYSVGSSYGKYIDPLTDEIKRIYGVSRKRARDMLIDACDKLKRLPANSIDTPENLLEAFTEFFPDTGRGSEWDRPRNALMDRHGDAQPLYRYELKSKIRGLSRLP